MLMKGARFAIFVLLLTFSPHLISCGGLAKESTPKVLCELGCLCQGQNIFLDCIKRNITQLPLAITFSPETTSISFQENFLTNLTEATFLDASNITDLNLSDNKLVHIEDYTFRSFCSTISLHLSGNRITNLTTTTLYGLTELRLLELSHNELSSLPIGFFVHTIKLQELRLQYNKLNLLSKEMFQFLNHLEKLDLSGNQIIKLPADIFQRTPRLQTLNLAANLLEFVPKESFVNVTWLHSLNLSQNHFKVLHPKSFSTLRNISLLYLNELPNLLMVEKDAFANMKKLRVLSCSYNKKLEFFHPDAFGHNRIGQRSAYPSDQLLMRENGLKTLPEPNDIMSWADLNHVDLRDNPWICDCKIRWMRKLKLNMEKDVLCESPFSVHGRRIVSLSEPEMMCYHEHWMISTIILIITSIIAVFVSVSMVLMIACYNTPIGRYARLRNQFSYKKFGNQKTEEALDLDWDPVIM